jgi:hypothetical protein
MVTLGLVDVVGDRDQVAGLAEVVPVRLALRGVQPRAPDSTVAALAWGARTTAVPSAAARRVRRARTFDMDDCVRRVKGDISDERK